jgi:hypothetical protein
VSAIDELAKIRQADPQKANAGRDEKLEDELKSRDIGALHRLLSRTHQEARSQLKSHRISIRATFSVKPKNYAPEAANYPNPRKAGAPILEHQTYTDTMALTFAAREKRGDYHFKQERTDFEGANDSGVPVGTSPGHEVIVVGDSIYTHTIGRPWFRRPIEDEFDENWLNQTYGAVEDLLSLAGVAGQISSCEETGDLLKVTLGLAQDASAKAFAGDPYAKQATWRDKAQVRALSGTIELDRATWTWRRADLELQIMVDDTPGGATQAIFKLSGTVEPLANAPAIAAPAESEPWPERERYRIEANELLDGLAPHR